MLISGGNLGGLEVEFIATHEKDGVQYMEIKEAPIQEIVDGNLISVNYQIVENGLANFYKLLDNLLLYCNGLQGATAL